MRTKKKSLPDLSKENVEKILDKMEKIESNAKHWMIVGMALTVPLCEIGFPVIIAGLFKALNNEHGRRTIRNALINDPQKASEFAKAFEDTQHAQFFSGIAREVERRKDGEMMKKYAGLRGKKSKGGMLRRFLRR